MNIAIVGSREFPNEKMVRKFVGHLPQDATVISGGARGVDSWAEDQADLSNIPVKVFPANWDEHGKKAGFLRNKDIVEAADMVIAFWDGESKGTKHTIDLAIKKGVPLDIHVRYNEDR